MSISFEVFPQKRISASVDEVMTLFNTRLADFCAAYQLPHDPLQTFGFLHKPEDKEWVSGSVVCEPPLNSYMWFRSKSGVVRFFASRDFLKTGSALLDTTSPDKSLEAELRNAASLGECWSFDRSSGATEQTSLGFGFLAAVFAELTDGFISTSDAWDIDLFPCKAEVFYKCYFRPELARRDVDRDWSTEVIQNLKRTYGRRS